MSSTNPSQPDSAHLSIPGELGRHARNLAELHLRSQGEPRNREELIVAMKSMFVAGWIDWALNARQYAPPEVKENGDDSNGPRT